jgi:outer membrane protein assembly factor BamB
MIYPGALTFPAHPAWTVSLGNGTFSYPVIAGGLVFVTTAPPIVGSDFGTQLYALDEHTGNTVWGPVAVSGTTSWSATTYENGKLFVLNIDGLLRSFDAATGTPGWSVPLPGQYAFNAPPNAYQGIVYIGGAGSGGTLYAVDEATGNILWTQGVLNGDGSSPAVDGNGVYASYPCQVYDFAPSTGAPIWQHSGGCNGSGGLTPVLKNGSLYARNSATGAGSFIYDAASGQQTGSFTATAIPAVSATTAVYMDSGTLRGVDTASGNVLWSFIGDGRLVSAPIIVNGYAFVGSDENLFVVDARTGALAWDTFPVGSVPAPNEQDVSQPPNGLASGEGMLVVPEGTVLTAWQIAQP